MFFFLEVRGLELVNSHFASLSWWVTGSSPPPNKKKHLSVFFFLEVRGLELVNSHFASLSWWVTGSSPPPNKKKHLSVFFFLEVRGLEPLTLGLQSRCSSQLSYTPVVFVEYRCHLLLLLLLSLAHIRVVYSLRL